LETPKEQYSKRLEMQKLQTLVTIEEVEVKTLAS
jgi:hypothetical protein